MNTIIIVDGSSYLYRAYYALPPLNTSKGLPTGAVRGVVAMLRSLQQQYIGSHIIVAFDAPGKTFRDEIYPEYKAGRSKTPDDLHQQRQPCYDFVLAMGFALVIEDGVEADDVIGTLAKIYAEAGDKVVISTSDKDMAQLVGDNVEIMNTMQRSRWDEQKVQEKFGVTPNRITDLFGLMGDSSDNIPGVPGIGSKTASALIYHLGTLDDIYADLDAILNLEIRGAAGIVKKLKNNRDSAFLSRDLATIKKDVQVDFASIDNRRGLDIDQLKELYKKYEFRTWAKELDDSLQKTLHKGSILSGQAAQDWLEERLKKHKICALIYDEDTAHYCCYIGDQRGYLKLEASIILDVMQRHNTHLVCHNIKQLASHLGTLNLQLEYTDVELLSYVLRPESRKHDIRNLAQTFLDADLPVLDQSSTTQQRADCFSEQAYVLHELSKAFVEKIDQIGRLSFIAKDIEHPLAPTLLRMEHHGILVDSDKIKQLDKQWRAKIVEQETIIYNAAQEKFNIASPKQLQSILYDKLGLQSASKTSTGQFSTDEATLKDIEHSHEIIPAILQYRHFAKLVNTYTDKLPHMLDKQGRIHTHYNQAIVSTGRLSSTAPNLQNIPIKTQDGERMREVFIAAKGNVLLAADYSQIELRIMAHLSQDKNLCRAFSNNEDVHMATAIEVFGQADIHNRRKAKAINFGLIYGMSAFGLARTLGITQQEAKQYMTVYFKRYPRVRDFMEVAKTNAREKGFAETIYGRRLPLPGINASRGQLVRAAERIAINLPMQGSAADIIKLAMIKLDKILPQNVRMCMQVHDELVFEVVSGDLEEVKILVKDTMENIVKLEVPLVVDIGHGANWRDAHV